MKKIKIIDPERWTNKIIKSAIYYLPEECRGGIAIDCGCNIGDFEINNGNRFNTYICYDILDENIEIMKKNLSELKLNLTIEKKACYNTGGIKIPIYAHQNENGELNYFGNSGNVGIKLRGEKKWGWFSENMIDEVETISIDDITNTYGEIKVLKFDIEGAEYEFLLGKDLSKIEYITGEIHYEEIEQLKLVEFISNTHQLINKKDNNIYTFKRK